MNHGGMKFHPVIAGGTIEHCGRQSRGEELCGGFPDLAGLRGRSLHCSHGLIRHRGSQHLRKPLGREGFDTGRRQYQRIDSGIQFRVLGLHSPHRIKHRQPAQGVADQNDPAVR